YIPRIDDTTKHGIWTDFAVWASLDGEDYVPALENGALELHLNNQKIKFEKPVKGRYFEFEVNEGYRGYVTCGDLKFFERAADTDERVSEVKEKYVLQIGSNIIKTEKNGEANEKQIDVAPFIDSGYTQIPLRGLLEEMGASLTWDGERQKIDITGDGIKIEMQIMNDAVYVTNDRLGRVRYTLQTPPQIKDSRTFVPLRFISENLGYNVAWNGETQEITITK
ncbi:MAG: stalk domain-containing protein, partial [Clostridia bacterium]|nr:stalk domain-containing protein [Clostridia bacterium]